MPIYCHYSVQRANKLSLNFKKTNYIVFALHRRRATYKDLDIQIDNVKIERVKSTKFSGVILSENLSWDELIKTVNSKISKNTEVICHLRYLVPRSVLINLYFSIINPYFAYCNIIWALCATATLAKVLKKQKNIYLHNN